MSSSVLIRLFTRFSLLPLGHPCNPWCFLLPPHSRKKEDTHSRCPPLGESWWLVDREIRNVLFHFSPSLASLWHHLAPLSLFHREGLSLSLSLSLSLISCTPEIVHSAGYFLVCDVSSLALPLLWCEFDPTFFSCLQQWSSFLSPPFAFWSSLLYSFYVSGEERVRKE